MVHESILSIIIWYSRLNAQKHCQNSSVTCVKTQLANFRQLEHLTTPWPACVTAWMIGQGQPQAGWPSCGISRKLLRALWNPSIRPGGGLKDKSLHGTWFMTKLWTFWSWMVKSRQRPEAVGGRQQPPFLQRNVNRSFNLTSLIWGPETVLVSNDQQLLSWSPFWVILNILCHSSHLDC